MTDFLLTVLATLVVVGAGFGVAAYVFGRTSGMEPPTPDGVSKSLPAHRRLAEADVQQVRFDVALRGYRMSQVDEVLRRLGTELAAANDQLAKLSTVDKSEPAVSLDLQYEPEKQRYEAWLADSLAGVVEYRALPDGALLFDHTEVNEEFRGRGIASKLIRFALDDVRKQGKQIVVSCSFVDSFIERNSEYRELLQTSLSEPAGAKTQPE